MLNTANYYLKQWKERAEEMEGTGPLNATVTLKENPSATGAHRFGMNPKLVDTRTFTRPKKQLQQQQYSQPRPFLNETMVMSSADRTVTRQLSESSNGSGPGINLQIGGLVTMANKALPIAMTQSSMQKSLIGDTSPPSSICSSTIDLGAERMMSSNGGGVIANETYLNGEGDKPATANGYNMDDVKRDLEMLQNLTFEDFGMDNKTTTMTTPLMTGENVEATILISRPTPVNETFDGVQNHQLKKLNSSHANGTFDLIGDEGGTCGQTMIIAEEEDENSTFNLTKLVKAIGNDLEEENIPVPQPPSAGLTTTVVEEDEIHLDFRRDDGECCIPSFSQSELILTISLLPDSFIQSTPICRDKAKQNDIFNFSPTGNDDLYRTIEMNMKNNAFKVPQVPSRFMDRAAMPVISQEKEVIDEKVIPESPALSTTVDLGAETPEDLQSSPEFEDVPELRQKGAVPVDMLRPEERQSLVNFEEYEKSLQLLDDNRNERDFDDMLASINTTDMRQSTEKMRQSLDSIKKRHSLINYERQQEELRRKVNDIDQEINNLTMESSGNGPRLLNRRSRLFDEAAAAATAQHKETVMNRTMDINTTNTLSVAPPVAQDEPQAERRVVPEKRDRDRFKTIKIFRKTLNSNIPDADETSIDAMEGNATQVIEREENEGVGEVQAPVQRGLVRPSRILARPKFASHLQRPTHLGIATQKASSADDLLDSRREQDEDDEEPVQRCVGAGQERGQSMQRTIPARGGGQGGKLKSPMGIKSKSIHNLMVNGGGQSRIGGGISRMSAQNDTVRETGTEDFGVRS